MSRTGSVLEPCFFCYAPFDHATQNMRGGWQLTGMANPKTIHDFGGFPQALFDQQYPAPGAPQVARSLATELKSPAAGGALGVDEGEWGLDHGTWSVLKPMFPKAQIPVMQLSMDYSRAPAEHYALGQQLKGLRDRSVLIVGSGNVVQPAAHAPWRSGQRGLRLGHGVRLRGARADQERPVGRPAGFSEAGRRGPAGTPYA